MTFALFGIENDGLNLAVNLLVFFLFVIYVALVYWTYADATRRLEDPLLVACATVAALFPFIGTIVYTIVRPPEFLEDRHEREIEVKAAEKRLALLENRTCRNCGGEVEPTFLRCPSCMRKLKEPCRNCGKPLDPRWRVCPYCESEVAGFRAGAGERPRRSRREAERAESRGERERGRRAERTTAGERERESRRARDATKSDLERDGAEANSGDRTAELGPEATAPGPSSQPPPPKR
jgi:Double zinc ribbon